METTFSQRVITAALSIPVGSVSTYGDIARVCGGGGQAARSISGILRRAQKNGAKNIPWHRIIYSNGRVWKNKQYDALRTKLYAKEKIDIDEKGYVIDFALKRYQF